jgi:hypothetical protein
LQTRRLACNPGDQIGDDREQVRRFLPEFDPENAVEIGVLHVRVVCEFPGERGFAVAAGAPQRRGDGDGVTFGVEQLFLQSVEFNSPLHEVGRRLRRHHGDALHRAARR